MLTILIVDDHRAGAETLQLALTAKGHHAIVKSNIIDALMMGIMEKRAVDVLITDYDMRNSDGGVLLKAFLAEKKDLFSILLSGFDADGLKGIDGFDVVMTKPLDIDKLERILDKWERKKIAQ